MPDNFEKKIAGIFPTSIRVKDNTLLQLAYKDSGLMAQRGGKEPQWQFI